MSYQITNETLALVEREIDDFLGDFPDDHPYQMALSLPYFRQTLKAKVLSKVPNRYRVISNNKHEPLPLSLFPGLLQERLLVEEKIRAVMPNIIQDLHHEQLPTVKVQTPWWIKIHTVIPCVTYFFGPFDSLNEAKDNHWGYIEDLIGEKASGITFTFQKKYPKNLTLEDSPLELKLDVQHLWQRLEELKSQKEVNEKLLESLPGYYLMTDLQGIIQSASSNIDKLLGATPQEVIGKSLAFFVSQKNRPQFYHYLAMMTEDMVNSQPNKGWSIPLQISAIAPVNVNIETTFNRNTQGEIIGWCWSLHDVSQLHALSQQYYHDSRHDDLTSLPNRRSLFDFLIRLIEERQEHDSKLFSLLLLDLNGFKKVNDRFGHTFGDQVLKAIAERLLACVRTQDKVTRLSGDEFAIILEEVNSVQDAKDCAYRIHHELARPLQIKEEEVTVSSSIGIVISNGQNLNADHLFSCADMAMYESKRNASPFVIFDDVSSEALQLEQQLHLDPTLTPPPWEQNSSGKTALNPVPEPL
ncbi:MAG: diguanylate cyclase domain-containing protein [Microcystaceae cyanobacterium]